MSSDVCLVTGGAGFIGCAVSGGLADSYDRVVVLDNLHPQVHAVRERPAAVAASRSACSQACGSTSVPGGCDACPRRTSNPSSASRTTTVQDWVDESMPATSATCVLRSDCSA